MTAERLIYRVEPVTSLRIPVYLNIFREYKYLAITPGIPPVDPVISTNEQPKHADTDERTGTD